MGKAAKEHRKKVAKRNANLKQQEKRMQKLWQDAFQEQMEVMREKFVKESGDTENFEQKEEFPDIDNINKGINSIEKKLNEEVDYEDNEAFGKKVLEISEEVLKMKNSLKINEKETIQEEPESTEPIQGE